jgi:hypothetical protein
MFITLADSINDYTRQTVPRLLLLTNDKAGQNPAPDKWSPKQILGHLIDSASNNLQRLVRAQMVPELVFPGYAQEQWVALQGYQESPWPDLVEFWRLHNWRLTEAVRRIPSDQSGKLCRIGDSPPVTLQFLTEDYWRHMKHHVNSILID